MMVFVSRKNHKKKTHTEYDATNHITLEKDDNYCEL